jgi:hypothetical protein
MNPRLRDIVTDALADEPDAVLMSGSVDAAALRTAPRCDAIVAESAEPDDDEYARRLLDLIPWGRVLLIATRGDRAAVYELQPHKLVMMGVSPSDLVRAIRGTLRA